MRNYLLACLLMLFTATLCHAQRGEVDGLIGMHRLTECPEIRDIKMMPNGRILLCGLREDIFPTSTVGGYIGTYAAVDGSLLQGHYNTLAQSAFACDTINDTLGIAVCAHRDSATHLVFITTNQEYIDYDMPSFFQFNSVEVFDIKTQRNGKILVAGRAEKNGQYLFFVARFSYYYGGFIGLDNTFGIDGVTTLAFGADAQARAIDILSNDKIIVVGHSIDPNRSGIITRLYTTGYVDSTFNGTGYIENIPTAPNSFVEYYSVNVDAADNIFCTGATQSGGCYTTISATGAIHSNYSFADAKAYYTSAISSNSLYMAGPDADYFQSYNGYSCVQIANAAAGSAAYTDTSFLAFRNSYQLLTEVDNAIFGSAIQPDGKLLLAGRLNGTGFFTRLITAGTTTGLPATTAQPAFSIYPNPATETILIKAEKITHLRITDLAGREVMQLKCEPVNQLQLNVSALTPAIYLVTINGNQTSKLVKTH